MSKNTITGLGENVSGALSYVLGPISGLVFLIIEKENKTVRFHAMQSFIYFGLLAVLQIALSLFVGVPFLGIAFDIALWALKMIWFASLVFLALNAYQGKSFKIPFIGESAWTQVNK